MDSELEEQLAHLRGLADELHGLDLRAELRGTTGSPYLKVVNPGSATLNERVLCHKAPDGLWHFAWPWQQPIGGTDDLPRVAAKVAAVLRTVESTS
jgi:hypothetical protein